MTASIFENTIYELGDDIYFVEEVEDESIAYVSKMIQKNVIKYDFPERIDFPKRLFINSPGGIVSSGLQFYDFIQRLKKNYLFTTIATGETASMGCIMLLAGDKRYVTKNAQLLFHPVSGGLQGTYEEIESQKRSMDIMNEQLKRITLEVSGLDKEHVDYLFKRENYLSAEEAVDLGICYGILDE